MIECDGDHRWGKCDRDSCDFMRRPGWSVVCDSCRNGEHMCGGDCECGAVWCIKRRLEQQGKRPYTEAERIEGTPAVLGLIIEGNCPVHRTELRHEADGRGYCDICAFELGAAAVGYRVPSVAE